MPGSSQGRNRHRGKSQRFSSKRLVEIHPSAAKADVKLIDLSARVNSCPFKTDFSTTFSAAYGTPASLHRAFSAGCEAIVPIQTIQPARNFSIHLLFADVLVPDFGVLGDEAFKQLAALACVEIDDLDAIFAQPVEAAGKGAAFADHERADAELAHQSAAIPAGASVVTMTISR